MSQFNNMKKAVLVISFGTSRIDALKKSIGAVEDKIRADFNTEVFRAFTSGCIIDRLQKTNGVKIDTAETALEKLYKKGYTNIFCVPTYIMNGIEYGKTQTIISKFTDKMNIRISRPLISKKEDYLKIVDIFSSRLTDKDRLYVLIGHGNSHSADTLYYSLDYHFKRLGMNNVFVGTVRGKPDLKNILDMCEKTDLRRITLLPFMLVCGSHAENDMAAVWKKEFEKHGFSVQCCFTGLGEIKEIQNMYSDRVKEIWGH